MEIAPREVARVEGYYRIKSFSLSHTLKDSTLTWKCKFCCNWFKIQSHAWSVQRSRHLVRATVLVFLGEDFGQRVRKVAKVCRHC